MINVPFGEKLVLRVSKLHQLKLENISKRSLFKLSLQNRRLCILSGRTLFYMPFNRIRRFIHQNILLMLLHGLSRVNTATYFIWLSITERLCQTKRLIISDLVGKLQHSTIQRLQISVLFSTWMGKLWFYVIRQCRLL